MVNVISLGGSVVAPDGVDELFLKDFKSLIDEFLREDEKRRFIFVVGGGGPARHWQKAFRNIYPHGDSEQADWIGIMATRLNAQLVRGIFGEWCVQDVVTDPTQVGPFTGKVLVASGWKPGFSSDYDAVLLAERFQADSMINLSNIEKVYSDDPKKNPDAKPIDTISWDDFRAMVGNEWTPGKNVPFDPVASRHAARIGLKVICAAGRDLSNLRKLLKGESFTGTIIGT
jgi:uridylate kinase